ncbi:hypothetical protein VTO73DRAFT_11193 [Trametes versicolor]
MSYYYDQSPDASSSKDVLDPQVSFTAEFGVATAGWEPSSGCGGSSWMLDVDEIPGQSNYLDYLMMPTIDTATEARLREQYAELCDEDALPAMFSGSADVPWASIAEEPHGVRDPMIDVAPREVQPTEWTVPRAFGHYRQGETLQGFLVDDLAVADGSRELGLSGDFTFLYPLPLLSPGTPPSTSPSPTPAPSPAAASNHSAAWTHPSSILPPPAPAAHLAITAATTLDPVPVTATVEHTADASTSTLPPAARPANKENQPPLAGPSTRSRSTRNAHVQPERIPEKRKRSNAPTLIPAPAPKPPREASAESSSAGAAAQPPRKRRKVAELEGIEMTPETRCGLGGCATVLRAPDLAAARVHMRGHISQITPAPPPPPTVDGPSAKRKETKKAEQQEKTPLPCPYQTPAGAACVHKPFADAQALQRHIEGLHYEWRFPCAGCGKRFPRRDALLRHYKAKPKCRPAGFKLS